MAGERILIVDDEPGVRSALEAILTDEGYDVESVDTGEAGLEALKNESYDAVFLDVWLPGIDGLEALQQLRDVTHDAQVLMISGHATIETAVRATKLGAFDFVEKPLSLDKTLLVLRNALRQRRLERANRHLLQQLSRDTEIVGRSAAANHLRRDVEAASAVAAPVLICGPPGSGRETVARRIHTARGPEAPFVEVPCAALDAAGTEAVLFGRPGVPGRIDLAAGGTLFLEDVDRMARSVQPRLAATLAGLPAEPGLRVLSSAGCGETRLEEELQQALDVIRVRVPELRARREDVPAFAERFMGELAREYARLPKRLAPPTLEALKKHDWPGNVRELRNLIERLLLTAEGEVVELSDLPPGLGGARGPAEDLYRDFASLEEGMKAFERHFILRVLNEEDKDVAIAARRLGISQQTLRRRMRILG